MRAIRITSKAICIAGLVFGGLLITGCTGRKADSTNTSISTIQIIDKNGFNETISSAERIAYLESNDFLKPQPYQKVVRVYKKNIEGKIEAKLTSYHENGQPWQYLETVNGRANGMYREWFSNGNLRMVTNVIEGAGDLVSEAQSTWLFDGKSRVWSEVGNIVAEIVYEKGLLEDQSTYYHPTGTISKTIPYHMDFIEGVVKVFSEGGDIIGTTSYIHGQKDGISRFTGNDYIPPREEEYKKGKLLFGKYWDFSENIIFEISKGNGWKPVFENGNLKIEHEFKNGIPEGDVKLYRENGVLESSYRVKGGMKSGEEWVYFDQNDEEGTLQPMLHIHWLEDEVHGMVRTWYENGVLESEKEMSLNKKNGILLAWYEDGDLMLVEEYENDILVSGKYLKKGEDIPVSRVVDGNGFASIFGPEGSLIRRIEYRKGNPVE